MICEYCGNEFNGIRRQKYCKECSTQRDRDRWDTNEYREKRRKAYVPRSKLYVCKRCNNEFIRNNSIQKYCETCGKLNSKEYQKKYSKSYRQTKKGKKAYEKLNRKRRAKLNSIKETFTMDEWNKKLDETKGVCPGCNKFIGKHKLTLDHIHPISKAEEGRVYTISDVQPLCKGCNSRKGIRESFIY